jgi:hypothetical protein
MTTLGEKQKKTKRTLKKALRHMRVAIEMAIV